MMPDLPGDAEELPAQVRIPLRQENARAYEVYGYAFLARKPA